MRGPFLFCRGESDRAGRAVKGNRTLPRRQKEWQHGDRRQNHAMQLFSTLDLIALACFIGAWFVYAITLEATSYGQRGLTALMHKYRYFWMKQMLARDVRIIDTQIVAALQNGNAFFASTSLIAVGGALTLLHSTDQVIDVIGALPFGIRTTAAQWQAKTMGLSIIFVYAFFKFAWSYRLFNYVAIMVGGTPPPEEKDTAEAKSYVERVARLSEVAGQHFNRGQRAFFFALGYLGWFVNPWVFIVATVAVVIVMWRRQFASDSRRAVME